MAASLLGTSLLLVVVAVCLNQLFGNSGYLKRALQDSKVYETLTDDALRQYQYTDSPEDSNELPMDREEIHQAAKEAFNPRLLQSSAETMIDGTYAWLEGKTAHPDFRVDLGGAKADFAQRIGSYARQRLASLPDCGRGQLPDTTDPFQINCRPVGFSFEPEIRRLTEGLASSPDYLADPVITANTLTVKNGEETIPVFERANNLPEAFRALRIMPSVFGLLATVAAGIIIGLGRPWISGVKQIARIFLAAGVITLISLWLVGFLADKLVGQAAGSSLQVADFSQQNVSAALINTTQQVISGVVLSIGVIYIFIGLLLTLCIRLAGRRRAMGEVPPAPSGN